MIRPEEFAISWTAQGGVQLGEAYEFLHALGGAKSGFEAFHVYPEGEHFVVADTGLVIGPLKADSAYEYAIGHESLSGLEAGAQVNVDREYTYTSVPEDVQGLTYIRTADRDKLAGQGSSFLSFQMNRDGTVYVAHDANPSHTTYD